MVCFDKVKKKMGNLWSVVVPKGVETDWKRYAGTWYEHRRLNSWFEPPGLYAVTATYTPSQTDPNTLMVVNQGVLPGGIPISASGTATILKAPGELQVDLQPDIPLVRQLAQLSQLAPSKAEKKANYLVLDHDCAPDSSKPYGCAVVGSTDRQYLWFLTRTPYLAPAEEQYMLGVVKRNGYTDTQLQMLYRVVQR